jgi:hypothetical protein
VDISHVAEGVGVLGKWDRKVLCLTRAPIHHVFRRTLACFFVVVFLFLFFFNRKPYGNVRRAPGNLGSLASAEPGLTRERGGTVLAGVPGERGDGV